VRSLKRKHLKEPFCIHFSFILPRPALRRQYGHSASVGPEMDQITPGRVRTRRYAREQNLKAVPVRPGQAAVALTTGQQGCEPMTSQVHDREIAGHKTAEAAR